MATSEIAEDGLQAIEAWLIQAGLRGEPDHASVSGFCERLKLIGDGILAIFSAGDRACACAAGLAATTHARSNLAALNLRRAREGLSVTDMYLGLHVGE